MNPMNDLVQAPARLPKPRRDYKDTLFRLLFQDRDRLLSLYNAVNGTSYDSPEELTVVTLGKCRVHEHEKRCGFSGELPAEPLRAPVHLEPQHAAP